MQSRASIMYTLTFSYMASWISVFILVIFGHCDAVANFESGKCHKSRKLNDTLFPPRYISIATSPFLLNRLSAAEEVVYNILLGLRVNVTFSEVHMTDCAIDTIKRYLLHYEETRKRLGKEGTGRPSNAGSNPLASFLLLRRIWFLLRPVVPQLDPDTQFVLHAAFWDTGWPTLRDVKTAGRAILRIQNFYDLAARDLANGRLAGEETVLAFSARDCHALGQQALDEHEYALAVEWHEEALRTAFSGEAIETILPIRRDLLEESLRWSVIKHDARLVVDPFDRRCFVQKLRPNTPERVRRNSVTSKKHWNATEARNEPSTFHFRKVCTGINYQTEAQKSKLFCFYKFNRHPSLLIGPLKAELISDFPLPIIRYYDLIGNDAIHTIMEDFSVNMDDSTFYSNAQMHRVTRSCRGENSTSLADQTGVQDQCDRLERAIQKIMGVQVSPESRARGTVTILAHPPGGHVLLHQDGLNQAAAEDLRDQLESDGNRIATVLFYLTDVVKGGWTAFPQSGLAVEPIRGSAVVWHNLKPSGDMNKFTWHGGCPVILGDKWLGSTWITSHNQMFVPHFKCTRDKDAIYKHTEMK